MLGSTIDCSDHRREPHQPPGPEEGWRLISRLYEHQRPGLRNTVIANVETFAEKDAGRPEVPTENEPRRPISA